MPTSAVADRADRLHAAGLAASEAGRPREALRKLRAGLRLIESDPSLAELRGRLLVSLAWVESERGDVELGFRLLDRAEPVTPPERRPVLCAQRAVMLKRSGRNAEALRWFDRAVAGLSTLDQPADLVKALNNRSLLHLDAGRVALARADLRRCLDLAARRGLTLFAALSRVNLGCLDVLAGDLPAALATFARARADYETLAPGRLPALAVERARALAAAGLYAEADAELSFAMSGAAPGSHIYADAVQVRAEAALLGGSAAAAGQWAAEARARFTERGNLRRAAVAALLDLRAHPAGRGVDPAAARHLAARLRRLGLAEDARVAGLLAARALAAAGRPAPAARTIERHGPPGRLDRLDTRLLWRLARADVATARQRPAEAARELAAGMATLHRYRSQFGSLDLQTGAAVHGRDLARAGLAGALASGSIGTVFRWSERVRAQALLLPPARPDDPAATAALEELRQVRAALRECELDGRPAGGLRGRAEALQRTVRERAWSTPGRRAEQGPRAARLSEARAALAGAAMVTYLRDGDDLHALLLTGGAAALVRLGSYRAATEAVLRLRADLDAQAGRAMPARLAAAVAAATRHDAAALAKLILDPLLPALGDRNLVVVPTGALVTVPWFLLPPCSGRPVTVAPSATTWLAARARATGGDGAALVVAGPGNDRGEAEAHQIAALHPHRTVLTGDRATPEATLSGLDGAAVAHLAAHGHHRAENALFSALDLAGGPILGYDLQDLRRPPGLVVLSSCEVGLADVRPGDETVGMVTALLRAGSATAVASVSRVADEAAMTVMVEFHSRLVAGHPPAAALAAALPTSPPTGFVCFGAG